MNNQKSTKNTVKFALLTLGILCLFNFPILGNNQAISLKDFATWVYKYHPVFQSQRIQIKQQENSIYGSQGSQDWSLTSSVSNERKKPINSSSFSAKKTETHIANLAANKMLWRTGGTFSTYLNSSQLNQDLSPVTLGDSEISFGQSQLFQQQIGISYTHPLLKNKNGAITKYPYMQQKEIMTSLQLSLQKQTKDFLLTTIESYLEWVYLHEQQKRIQKQLRVASKSLRQLKQKYKDNIIEKLDVLRQTTAVQTIQNESLSIKAQLISIKNKLGLLSNLDPQTFNSPQLTLTSTIPIEQASNFKQTTAYKHLESQHRLNDLLKQKLIQERKASLDFNVSYGQLSGSDTFSDSWAFDKNDQRLSLIYSQKIHNRSLAASLQTCSLETERINQSIAEHEMNFTIKHQQYLNQINKDKKIIKLSENQLRASRDTVQEEKRLYAIGKRNLSFVLQAEENLYRTENLHIQRLYQAQRNRIHYLALTDNLIAYFLPEANL